MPGYLYYIMLEVVSDAAMRVFREPAVQLMKEVAALDSGPVGSAAGLYGRVQGGEGWREVEVIGGWTPTVLLVLWLGMDPS